MDYKKLCTHCMHEVEAKLRQPCPVCGRPFHVVGETHYQLKPFSVLHGKYLVGDVLGEGGFGITYIGMDMNLEVRVAIKEFYPSGYCTREANVTNNVTLYQERDMDYILKWKERFLNEARCLGKFSNLSGVVGVRDFFRENQTAYIVMEYLEGITLKEYARSVGGKIPVKQLLESLEPVILSLNEVHKQGLIHRDISPDNIMLLPDGSMKLLDFGAARSYDGDNEKSLSVMLKPGYAPEEQYRRKGKQGPWSDVYAFAATIYKCITGVTPPEAMDRMRADELVEPRRLGVDLTQGQEEALLKALSLYAENRYQNMKAFHDALYGNAADDNKSFPASDNKRRIGNSGGKKFIFVLTGVAAALLLAVVAIVGTIFLTARGEDAETWKSVDGVNGEDAKNGENEKLAQPLQGALEKCAAQAEKGHDKLKEAEQSLQQAYDEVAEGGGNIWENDKFKDEAMSSAYDGIEELRKALEGYAAIEEEYGVLDEVTGSIDETRKEYQNGILLRIGMLQEYPLAEDMYGEIMEELDSGIALAEQLGDANLLKAKQQEIPEWRRGQYCTVFDEMVQGEKWARSELWSLMNAAYEEGLFEADDLDDPLRLRYSYAYAYYIEKLTESDGVSAAAERIYDNIEVADFNPALFQIWADYEYEQQSYIWSEAIRQCGDAILAVIEENEGFVPGEDVSMKRFWYFNDFEHYAENLSDGEWNGVSPKTRQQIRKMGKELLEKLKYI